MERFVRAITGGGLVLVAGLWIVTYSPTWSVRWLSGGALAVVGVVALAYGIWLELDY